MVAVFAAAVAVADADVSGLAAGLAIIVAL